MKRNPKEPRDYRYWYHSILYKIGMDVLLAYVILLLEGWFGHRSDTPGHPSGGLAALFLIVASLVTLGMGIHAFRLRHKEKQTNAPPDDDTAA